MNITERIELEKRWHEKTGLSLGRRLADIHELGRQSAQDEAEAWRASLSIVAEALGVSLDEAPAGVGLGNWLASFIHKPTAARPGGDITSRLRCKYPVGVIGEDGEPEFGWRDFSGPAPEGLVLPTPLMLEAANCIDAQAAEIERLRIQNDGYDGTIAKRDLEIERLRKALETAKSGLEWYQGEYPEAVNGCDDEAMAQIDAALDRHQGESDDANTSL